MKQLVTSTLLGIVALTGAHAAEVGKAAPAFTVKDTQGKAHSLVDFKDKVVVLEWINHDCPFVKKHYSGKSMQKLQADYTAKDVVWLSVNSSAEGKQGYLEAVKLAEKVTEVGSKATATILDTDGAFGKAYGAKVTPHMMIIAKDGTLAYSGAIDSKPSTNAADIESATPLFANALDAVLSGQTVENASNQAYGCGVKY